MFRRATLTAAVAFLAASSFAQAQNLITNPNFSGNTGYLGYGPLAGWTQTPFPSGTPGYPYLTGTNSQGGAFYDNGNSGTPTVGFIQTYSGTEINSLSQVVAMTPGQTYDFSFLENARAITGVDPVLTLDIGGDQVYSDLVTPVGNDNPFTLISGSFLATSYSEPVLFIASSTGDASVLLADVNVSAVTPEPSSFALLGTGLLGVAGVVRRRLA